ncbi:phosphoribosylanthranilate isomerase [Phormidium sp. LEGE 05292]|uniref:phosphoribosylanthranilate isomerase n=1 Tax=[Phormidium] sp. LEGE 05292 TaxID=767427 RepID=UPI00187E0880|nr:phosphoribosylanthranilate isomerase [Phormidium sp. LEGE 05292]MBE9227210.1 phosphoribosylanthranilate isomerase [Phormidium sp. LEGE 05292]
MRVKICGITKLEQGNAIAQMGATALGFICVASSPRYVSAGKISAIIQRLSQEVDCIGVFANTTIAEICQTVTATDLSGVQLHGNESPEFCQQLRQYLPEIEIIKALRVRTTECLTNSEIYANSVDMLLLDAYHPTQLGGTGKTLDWTTLQEYKPCLPWLLAGGLTPDNIVDALSLLQPDGIDLSSGVERSPGEKDLDKVAQLFTKLRQTEQLLLNQIN